jgi:micrococcal nuclease
MYEYRAKVDRVIDGDTVDFIVDLGFNVTIKIRGRFAGVDTPERGHPDWSKATAKCRELLRSVAKISYEVNISVTPDEIVTIKTEKTGKYGRWIVEIPGVTDKLAEIWPYKRSK